MARVLYKKPYPTPMQRHPYVQVTRAPCARAQRHKSPRTVPLCPTLSGGKGKEGKEEKREGREKKENRIGQLINMNRAIRYTEDACDTTLTQ